MIAIRTTAPITIPAIPPPLTELDDDDEEEEVKLVEEKELVE